MHHFVEVIIFVALFLLGASLLQEFCKRKNFPYTVGLLLFGFGVQLVSRVFHLPIHLEMDTDVIYFVLLPLLLFGSALHINIHQFKLQFKTIAFAATFGLMLSVGLIASMMVFLLGLPIDVALIFGAMISATDPIAVLSLFKTLGVPQRLALLADGESMFNDATAVVLFRVFVAMFLGGEAISHASLLTNLGEFGYVFFGSLAAGAVFGYLLSVVLAKIENDISVETTLTVGSALIVFAGFEHWLHLSGVISSVVAGLVAGNLGRSRFSPTVIHFVHEFWDYVGFLSVSLVFFFATLHLDIFQFTTDPGSWIPVIGIVLVARAVSTYLTYGLTNRLPMFSDEPDVPMNWQHVLNWGGLRGVIPLVLVFALPDDYVHKELLFVFTFSTLLFSLFVNGTTIGWLIKKLGLHNPGKATKLHDLQDKMFQLEKALGYVSHLPKGEFGGKISSRMAAEVVKELASVRHELRSLTSEKMVLLNALKRYLLKIERSVVEKLHRQHYIHENVYFDYESQLDLQADALEYPEVFGIRGITKKGKIYQRRSFRKALINLRLQADRFTLLQRWLGVKRDDLIVERYSLLKVRVIAGEEILEYLTSMRKMFVGDDVLDDVLDDLQQEREGYMSMNKKELKDLATSYKELVFGYQDRLLHALVNDVSQSHH